MKRTYLDLSLLDELYQPSQIYIRAIELNNPFYSDFSRPYITAECFVDFNVPYTKRRIPYVTDENYTRCISQASYILAELLIKQKLIDTNVSLESFYHAAEDWKIYYRKRNIKYHMEARKQKFFSIDLALDGYREITLDRRQYVLLKFKVVRRAFSLYISGSVSFIFPSKTKRV